jgi:hypothetical protein
MELLQPPCGITAAAVTAAVAEGDRDGVAAAAGMRQQLRLLAIGSDVALETVPCAGSSPWPPAGGHAATSVS